MTATFDNKIIMSVNIPSLSSPNGFVAVGPDRFGVASFDNLRITRADISPSAKTVSPHYKDLQFVSRNNEQNMIVRKSVDVLQEHIDKQRL